MKRTVNKSVFLKSLLTMVATTLGAGHFSAQTFTPLSDASRQNQDYWLYGMSQLSSSLYEPETWMPKSDRSTTQLYTTTATTIGDGAEHSFAKIGGNSKENCVRIVLQRVTYTHPIPSYTRVAVSYRFRLYSYAGRDDYARVGTELIDWGTSSSDDRTASTTYKVWYSGTNAGYSTEGTIGKVIKHPDDPSQSSSFSRTWTFDNPSSDATTGTHYMAALFYSGSLNYSIAIKGWMAYSEFFVTRTDLSTAYYNQITYDYNGGTGSISQTPLETADHTTVTPTREGYVFVGWVDDEGNVFQSKTYSKDNAADRGVHHLTARWSEPVFYFDQTDGAWSCLSNWSVFAEGLSEHRPATFLPTAASQVIVSKAVTIPAEVSCYSLILVDGGSVTIAPTGGLSVGDGGVTGATTDNFIIESTTEHQGYFRMSPNATTPMPTATVQFATRSTLDTGADRDATWQYFGVPCSTNFTCDNATWLNRWNTASGWVSLAQGQSHTLSPWQGYCITQYGQPTYLFAGQLINSNQNISLTGTAATQGMNLIANSYSAPIDVTKFTAEDFSGDLIQTFYIYNAGSWNQWNNNKSATPSATGHTPGTYTAIPALAAAYLTDEQTLIAPMQAIMMQMTDVGTATVNFDYAKHVWAAAASGGSTMTDPILAPEREPHPQPLSQRRGELSARVRLSVGSANSGVDHLYLLEGEDWTADYNNGYDAPKMATRGLANIYTTISEGMLAVDARAHLDSTYIGFAAGEDEEYTLCASLLPGDSFTLIDLANGSSMQLTEGATCTFYAAPYSTDDRRFLLVRTPLSVPTDLTEYSPHTTQPTCILRNGRICIRRGEQLYSLQGIPL